MPQNRWLIVYNPDFMPFIAGSDAERLDFESASADFETASADFESNYSASDPNYFVFIFNFSGAEINFFDILSGFLSVGFN